jgi:hypothetical protein
MLNNYFETTTDRENIDIEEIRYWHRWDSDIYEEYRLEDMCTGEGDGPLDPVDPLEW